MHPVTRFSAFAALSLALPAFGCAASTEEAGPASNDSAVSAGTEACGAAKYNEALGHYKAAVAKAKRQLQGVEAGNTCGEPDGATVADVAGEANKAVQICGAFKETVKTSPWAGELRAVLEPTLAYGVIVGDVNPQTWEGLPAALVGVTAFGPAPGAYGNVGKLTFETGGRGKMAILHIHDDTGEPYWGGTDMRYVIENKGGSVTLKVIAEYENETETTFEYTLRNDGDFYGSPNFKFELQNGTDDTPGAYQSFDTFPSECEA